MQQIGEETVAGDAAHLNLGAVEYRLTAVDARLVYPRLSERLRPHGLRKQRSQRCADGNQEQQQADLQAGLHWQPPISFADFGIVRSLQRRL